MNKRLLSVLAFALIISAAASLMLYRLVSARMSASLKSATTQIVVASRNIKVGTLLGDMDLKMADWQGAAPARSVVKKEDAIGRGVIANIYEGEPILDDRLAARGAGAGMAAIIPSGMRAFPVAVNEVVGVAGFVVPGMRVDVLIAGVPPGGSGNRGTLSKTLLQSVEVLSAGQRIDKDAEGKPQAVSVVNLLVTPEQAETLTLATHETRVQLVLRNPLDTKETKTPGSSTSILYAGTAVPPPKLAPQGQPRPATQVNVTAPKTTVPERTVERIVVPITVEVIHGTSKQETKFQPASEDKEKK